MNTTFKCNSVDSQLKLIMDALVASYGSLTSPDFRKVYITMSGPSHQKFVAELRRKVIDVLETSDENDDVSTQLVAARSGDQVSVGLSGVGPFATVIHCSEDGRYSWVTKLEEGPTPLAELVAMLVEQAGFQLLDRDILIRTIAMNRPDGSTEATLNQALFTDSDRIP